GQDCRRVTKLHDRIVPPPLVVALRIVERVVEAAAFASLSLISGFRAVASGLRLLIPGCLASGFNRCCKRPYDVVEVKRDLREEEAPHEMGRDSSAIRWAVGTNRISAAG